MHKTLLIGLFILCLFLLSASTLSALEERGYPAILSLREQARLTDLWLKIRLDTVLPQIMRRQKVDMWLVICREYNEDPVFFSLVPAEVFSARRLTVLIFYDKGEAGVDRMIINRYDMGDWYRGVWEPNKSDAWESLAAVIARLNPRRIAVNLSRTDKFSDGLSAGLHKKLLESLDNKYRSRVYPEHSPAAGWLERRIPEELEVYPQICAVAHRIIAEAFFNRVITPGVTTTDDVQWWILAEINRLGLKSWFFPTVDFQRPDPDDKSVGRSGVIRRGDLLHCDVGLTYLGLNTDTQELGYVLKLGESDVPLGLKNALVQGNRLQDVLSAQLKVGRTGNQVLAATLAAAKKEGLRAQVYSHALGFHGHGAGGTIGLWDQQDGVPGAGDYPLYASTCYAIELNVKPPIPEWNNQVVRIGLEQDALLDADGIHFLDGRQTTFHIIR